MTSTADFDNLDFNIKKEAWNEYELKDGTKLKGRVFLTRIGENKNSSPPPDLRPNEKYAGAFNISVQNNFQVFSPELNKGKPTLPLPPLNKITPAQMEETEVITSNEPWNIYEIVKNGMIIRVKLVISEVYKIKGKFDQFGEPYYSIKSAPVFDYKPPTDTNKFA